MSIVDKTFKEREDKERADYLVAFLAAFIGISAFKEELSSRIFNLFGHDFTCLTLGILIMSLLIGAVYLNALIIVISSFNITVAPLKRYVDFTSSLLAGIGLCMPILFFILWLFSGILNHVSYNLESVTTIVQGILTSFSVFAAYSFARRRESQLMFYKEIRYKDHFSKTNIEYDVLRRYEEFIDAANEYLDIVGFATAEYRFSKLVHILKDKDVFNEEDLELAKNVNELRNQIAHMIGHVNKRDLIAALQDLDTLKTKIDRVVRDSLMIQGA